MDEKRIDTRVKDEERTKEMIRSERLCARLNNTLPFTALHDRYVHELFVNGIGEHTMVHTPIYVNRASGIFIGDYCSIQPGFSAMTSGTVTIGNYVQIALGVSLISNNHDFYDRSILVCKPVVIKDHAWIGANATILPGVTVGEYAVVGAGSVVTKDVEDYTVVAGNPAKVIRVLEKEKFNQ